MPCALLARVSYTVYEMALLPSIPTSFVPRPPAPLSSQSRTDLSGAFGLFAYAVLGITFLLALGVFFYGQILASNKASKDNALSAAEASIDSKAVENFARLRNRLTTSKTLLDGHVAFSGFFSSLEKVLPTTVRFTALRLSFDTTGVPRVEGGGIAKSFNSLAAASTAFAADGRVKDAIFSNININKDGSVSFVFTATLDPKIIAFSP